MTGQGTGAASILMQEHWRQRHGVGWVVRSGIAHANALTNGYCRHAGAQGLDGFSVTPPREWYINSTAAHETQPNPLVR